MRDDYEDIIDLPHYRSKTRKPMPMEARAAQFAPFAALGRDNNSEKQSKRGKKRRRV